MANYIKFNKSTNQADALNSLDPNTVYFTKDTEKIILDGVNYSGPTLYDEYKECGGTMSASAFPIAMKYHITPFMISNNSVTTIPEELLNTSKTNFITDYYWNLVRITGGEPVITIQWNNNIPSRIKGLLNGKEFAVDFTTRTITPIEGTGGSQSGSIDLSGYALKSELNGYLPLSGGTLTGALNITHTKAADDCFIFKNTRHSNEVANWADPMFIYKDATDKVVFRCGVFGQLENLNYVAMGIANSENWWASSTSFRIYSDRLSFGDNTLLHAGNYSSYALPLTGGNVSGDITFPNLNKGIIFGQDGSITHSGQGTLSISCSYLDLDCDMVTSAGALKFGNGTIGIYGSDVDTLSLANESILIKASDTIDIQASSCGITCSVTAPAFYQTSDIRKKDIKSDLSLDKCYDLIDKCQTIIYTLKEQTEEQIGLIAQEIEEFFPEVVATDEEGFKSLAYDRLVVICFKVLKDVIKRLEKLENHG